MFSIIFWVPGRLHIPPRLSLKYVLVVSTGNAGSNRAILLKTIRFARPSDKKGATFGIYMANSLPLGSTPLSH